ncbi:hypothetical protein GALMADRAFT_238909 [Galerina marginata CBS 339.88]|uniref:DUF6533 domain-containing protein n=1 Tax=Galerina marginata (strain CBS 339.88) TaxID=685588 RepID=A0A067TL76_GALM3|nr:hypothetical protein GALMADRAFT_238909 [Galerina marginata CBS 339.88]
MTAHVWPGEKGGTRLYSPWSSPTIATGAQASNRSSVAALTFLVWDMLITFDDEVRLIWPQNRSLMKWVYFLARYFSLAVQIPLLLVGSELSPHFHFTHQDCYIWQIYQGITTSMIILTVDVILIIRVRALYHGHRLVCHGVSVLFLLEIISMIVGLALSLPGIEFDNICTVLHIPLELGIFGLGSIAFQTVLFGLTLYRFIRDVNAGWHGMPLIALLIRDGTWAFLLLFFVYMGQIGLNAAANPMSGGILFPWMLTLCSFCGYRIFLNLRRFAVDGLDDRIANISSILETTTSTGSS